MNRLGCFMYLLVCIGGSACTTLKSSTRDYDRFPAISMQTETKLLETSLPTPQIMIIYRDSLLLVMNNLNSNPHHIRVFDIALKKKTGDIFPASQKKGGTLSFMSFGISGDLVWVFDVAKNGFIVANLDSLLAGQADLTYYSEYRIKPQIFYYDAYLLNRSEALLSGNYDTDEKLVSIHLTDSTRNKQLLSYRQDTTIGSSRVNKMSYESFILVKPDQQKMVLACRYADQFELLSLTGDAYKKVRGPVGFAPELAPFEDNTGTIVATPDNRTQFGFLKGHVTDNYFYLLFSGEGVKSDQRFYSNKIFVYDWNGKPVRQINLKNDIVDFAVSSDDKILYTLNPRTRAISFSVVKW